MSISRGHVKTQSASKYLQQLCKHWSHKLPVEFNPHLGVVTFEKARVTFDAADDALAIEIASPEPDEAERMQGVVARHIERFAFREQLAFSWSAPA